MSHGDARTSLDRDQVSIPPGHAWNRLPWIGAAVALISLVASSMLAVGHAQQFYFSWLVAFTYFLSIALGAMFFVLSHFATGARWSVVLRRLGENVMATLPVFILLFVPVLMGVHDLYHWSHDEAVAHDALLQGKQGYLNLPFFLVRAAIYFVCWTLIAWWFLRTSRNQDHTGNPAATRRMIQVSAPAIAVFALSLTFASIDWIMSLDPHWYSTIFGVYYFSGGLVGFFAFLAILSAAARRAGLLRPDVLTLEHFHDVGKLLFAFTVFWAYIGFSQYFLIWYGNIPEETLFYMHRAEGGWKTVSMFLAWGHFGVPFFFLMSRHVKRRTGLLVIGALWMLFMHFVDLYWLIMPVLHHHDVHWSLLDLTNMLAVGGIFVAAVGWHLKRQALVPVRDPRLAESLGFENL